MSKTIWTAWWFGGFGFGIWRSVYPQGPIWSFALGPLTLLARFPAPTPEKPQQESECGSDRGDAKDN